MTQSPGICKSLPFRTVRVLFALVLLASSVQSFAQTLPEPASSVRPNTPADTATASYAALGFGAFLPLEQSYRINYSTSTLGLPVELDGDLLLPLTHTLQLDVAVDYMRRNANFISNTRITSISVQPGVRLFLEPQRPNDFRIFALGAVIISRTVVEGVIDASVDGVNPNSEAVSRTYLPIGGAIGLGLSYPLTAQTAIDGSVRTSVYFGSTSTSGGLGNIGGVSLIIQYRFGL